MILSEAADRFEFTSPYLNIKSLKVPKTDVEPFTLDEVLQILSTVRDDFRNYYTVRFFTGMRTAEVDGLQWKYVDFQRRQILIRETWVGGKLDYTKNDGSQREIDMSEPVYQALIGQREKTGSGQFVFCTREGTPHAYRNINDRVWYPLLRHLGLRRRRPKPAIQPRPSGWRLVKPGVDRPADGTHHHRDAVPCLFALCPQPDAA